MGTKCITRILDEQHNKICGLDTQYDGYPEGHGMDLYNFLSGKKLINGIPNSRDNLASFNGMGCLAASVVAHFKTGIGHHYLLAGENTLVAYIYDIYQIDNEIYMKVADNNKVLFDDNINKFGKGSYNLSYK